MPATCRLGRFLAPYWWWAILAPLMMVLEGAMDLLQPRLLQHIIDAGVVPGNMTVVMQTGVWMAIMATIGLGGGLSELSDAIIDVMSLTMASMLILRLSRAEASAVRIQEVLESEPEVKDKPGALADFTLQGEVVFDWVNFSYNGADCQEDPDPVLKGISFVAKPGQTVAIPGATGSGKSSLIQLIPRFYDVCSGQVTIDGVDVREFDEAALRGKIGIALQESILFSGTIRDNIRYGRLDATDEEVIAAAKLANADQFIHRLPQDYITPLSERGSNLSRGQRQLLAIARAILADPASLILDEATSSVDTRTEKPIQEAMRRLMAGRTSFVIAHRLSTICDADQILVIDGGRIIERGKHEELLARQGFCHHLYTSQFRASARRVANEEEAPAIASVARPAALLAQSGS